jgi:hypothetical protein
MIAIGFIMAFVFAVFIFLVGYIYATAPERSKK